MCFAHRVGLAVVCLLVTAVSNAQTGASGRAPEEVTFSNDIAPILQRSCQTCHRPGALAPMSFLTYEDTRPWARAIKLKTERREMPPWFIEKNIGIQRFKNDPSLSDEEIATFGAWADAGAPRGDAEDLPPPIEWADASEWSIGTPDLVVSSPEMLVPAVSADYHNEFGPVATGLAADQYIKAVEVREVRLAEPKERQSGFGLFTIHHLALNCGAWVPTTGGQVDLPREQRDGFRLTYEIGQNATVYPADTGVVLESGCELNFSVHLFASGEPVPVRADVGFVFHTADWKPKYVQSGFTVVGDIGDGLDIPGGASSVRVDGYYTLPQGGLMTTYEPHMHAAGRRMCAEAIYPDRSRGMLNCSAYDHNWARAYASLRPLYVIDKRVTMMNESGFGQQADEGDNLYPTLRVEGELERSVRVGEPLRLTAVARDDGLPVQRAGEVPSHLRAGLMVGWLVYRGDAAGVTFDPVQFNPDFRSRTGPFGPCGDTAVVTPPEHAMEPLPANGRVPVTVTFSRPGAYVLRVMAHDGALKVTREIAVNVNRR